jgi:hypothetical protein
VVPFDRTKRKWEGTSNIKIILYETGHWCFSHEKLWMMMTIIIIIIIIIMVVVVVGCNI